MPFKEVFVCTISVIFFVFIVSSVDDGGFTEIALPTVDRVIASFTGDGYDDCGGCCCFSSFLSAFLFLFLFDKRRTMNVKLKASFYHY